MPVGGREGNRNAKRISIAAIWLLEILTYKNNIVRENILYSAFDLLQMSFHSLRHRRDAEAEDDGAPLSPVSPETLFPHSAVHGTVIEK